VTAAALARNPSPLSPATGGAGTGGQPLSDVDGADRLALAELELARIEAGCRYDSCEADCRVAAAVRRSVEAMRSTGQSRPVEVVAA